MSTITPVPATPATPPLLLCAIVTKQSGVFICATLPPGQSSWNRPTITGYVFDGVAAVLVPTRVDHWFKIPAVPSKVEKVIAATSKTVGFSLLPGFAASERLPSKLTLTSLSDTIYEGVSECYERVVETIPESRQEVPFSLHVIAERDKFEVIKADFNLQYGLLDQLTVDPILLQERPCRLDGKQSYALIRKHIKDHINPKWARISSDYDFCLTVEKRIPLPETVPFTRDVKRGKRWVKQEDYRTHREVEVYKVSPPDEYGKPYSNYPLVAPFVGTSYEDLQSTIKSFLDNLMAKINEPIRDCPHCKGKGVIIEVAVPSKS